MAKERSLVRASDIGAWAFCHRAWYLAQVKGVAHARPERLAQGNVAHAAHGRQMRRAGQFQRVGLWLTLAALLLAAVTLLWWWVG
jgi:hypothetical protein